MRAAERARTGALALLLAAALPARAQTLPLEQDCDGVSVASLAAGEIDAAWLPVHPSTTRARLGAGTQGEAAQALAALRGAFLATAAARTPPAREHFIPRLDSLARVVTSEHAAVTYQLNFNPDVAPEGGSAVLFPGTGGEIVLDDRTPPDVRRGLCWTAISATVIIDAYVEPTRTALVKRLADALEMWDNYTDEGYSQYPWELFINGLTGSRRGGIDPPRTQWVVLHPGIGVSVAGQQASSLRRLDVIPLEIVGHLWYNRRRTGYRGLSLVTSFATDADPSIGPFVHVGRGVGVGATWRGWGDDDGFGGLLFSADLYRALAGVPGDVQERIQELRDALARETPPPGAAVPASP